MNNVKKQVFKDQLGRNIEIHAPAMRIVSLVPSQTELLLDFDMPGEVLGRTKFCIHPADKVKDVPVVGGTKKFHIDRIDGLIPDLIIANKEENDRRLIGELMKKYPVWVSDVKDLEDAMQMIRGLGEITGAKNADQILAAITKNFEELKPDSTITAAYCIWKKPFMFAGGDTFIHDMMQRAGFRNIFENDPRYPEKSVEEINGAQPDVILFSSEPYPFKQEHLDEFEALFPNIEFALVDGTYFSWYGSRLEHAPAYFEKLRRSIGLQ